MKRAKVLKYKQQAVGFRKARKSIRVYRVIKPKRSGCQQFNEINRD